MVRVPDETLVLSKDEQWVAYQGKGMDGNSVEWFEITPDEAKAKVQAEASKYGGYIVDEEDADGVFLCSRNGAVYSVANGISQTWTLHVYRTKGLPAQPKEGLFTDEFARGGKGKELRRVGRGEGLADADQTLSLFGSVDPHDLTQGSVGNCWLISAFAAAAEFPKAVTALCQQQKLAANGRYDVRLYHPVKEKWECIMVDDSFPVHDAGLKFANMGNQGEIWPCVLEKALAKMFGGYDALEGNTSLLAFKTMFGAKSIELISLDRESNGKWTCYTPHFEDEGGATPECNKVSAPWLDGFSLDGTVERLMDDKFFELLEDLDETGCIMCCAAGRPLVKEGKAKKSKGHSGEMIGAGGLVRDHAYTLLRAVDDVAGSGFDLIEMRNPWGKGEWTGAWSDNSDMWEIHPEVKRFLRPESIDDGKFWISKEDFANNFDGIQVCLSKEMRKRYDAAVECARERALSGFTRHPGCGFSGKYCEQMFISDTEAQELCKAKPGEWAGYIELPPDPDPTEEVGVIMLMAGGGLIGVDKGVPEGWTAFLHNFEAEEKPGKKQKREKKSKAAFEPPRPIPAWSTLMDKFRVISHVTDVFAHAGAQHALARAGKDANLASVVIRGAIFRPKNVPSRLAPISSYAPPKPRFMYGATRAIQPSNDLVLFQSQRPDLGKIKPAHTMTRSSSNVGPGTSSNAVLNGMHQTRMPNMNAQAAMSHARIWTKTPLVMKSSMSSPRMMHAYPRS